MTTKQRAVKLLLQIEELAASATKTDTPSNHAKVVAYCIAKQLVKTWLAPELSNVQPINEEVAA